MTKPKAKKAKRQPLLIEGKTEKDAPPPRRKLGEPGVFEDLCNWIGLGKSLRSWCEAERIDHGDAIRWIQADKERTVVYREARRMQADAHIDELIDLADESLPLDDTGRIDSGAVNDKRLRIDTRKWIAAKFHPAMYGDKVDVTATINPRETRPAEVMAQIAALLGAHGLRIEQAQPTEGDPT